MFRRKVGRFIRSYLFNFKWQLLSAVILTIASGFVLHHNTELQKNVFELEKSNYITILAVLATVLALIASVSFGFLLYYIADVTNRKVLAYDKLISFLYDIDQFLSHFPSEIPLVTDAQEFIFELKQMAIDEFPIDDWGERVKWLVSKPRNKKGLEDYPNLEKEITIRICNCEHFVNRMGIIWVKQILVGLIIRPVIKAFYILVALLFIGLFLYVLRYEWVTKILELIPILFGYLTILLIIEFTMIIRLEAEELMDTSGYDNLEKKN